MLLPLRCCALLLAVCACQGRCFRRLAFLSPRPLPSRYFLPGRSEHYVRNKSHADPGNSVPAQRGSHSALSATMVEDQPSEENLHDFSECPGFEEFLNKKFLFSSGILDSARDDLIARELDYRRMSEETNENMKRFIAIVLSTIAVGALYKFASFLKDIIEEQFYTVGGPTPV